MSNTNPPTNAFLPGNKVAEGNDKTLNLSTWVKKALKKPRTVKEYEDAIATEQAIAENFVETYFRARTPHEKKEIFAEIRDTTEGKPTQRSEITGPDGGPINFHEMSEEELMAIAAKATKTDANKD